LSALLRPEIRTATAPAFVKRGCVNVIGLEEFKREAGPRWEHMRETIYARIEVILRQTLGPADFFIRLSDTAYIVTMPASAADDSQLCCLRVAHELHTSLLGPCAIGQLNLSRAMSVGDDLVLDQIVIPELAQLARRAGLNDLTISNAAKDAHTLSRPAAQTKPPRPVYSHGFVPIWDSRNEAVTSYRLVSKRSAAQLAMEAEGSARFKEDLALTVASFYFGAGVLARHLESNERFLLQIPVLHEVLSSPIGRMEIASTCRDLSGEFRPFLVFELTAIPPGVPQSRMAELVSVLRPFCRGVAAQIPLRDHGVVAYQGIGLQSIGIVLPRAGTNATEMRVEIARLAGAAKRLALSSFVSDVPSLDLFSLARIEGVALMSGDVIGAAQSKPSAMHRLPAAQILRSDSARSAS
jgi:hypothetical protein